MGLLDVYRGHQTWADFIGGQALFTALEELSPRRTRDASTDDKSETLLVGLTARDHRVAVESGLGALNPERLRSASGNALRVALGIEQLAGGLESLKADFNLLMGDIVWRLEMGQESLTSVLEEIRLAEFEREARAYRTRAERAYLNGWYEEALGDFLEAEKRNYPDYTVHRSIAQIYLYHVIDLPKALEYFLKAAKYAMPSDQKQAAEAHHFAGIVYVVERQSEAAIDPLRQGTELPPALDAAPYEQSGVTSLPSRGEQDVTRLARAITGDERYHERAKRDAAFDSIRARDQAVLDQL